MKTTIDMAREAGAIHIHKQPKEFAIVGNDLIKAFEALVRADEREKSLQLWMLLDDVDTADDIAKTDEAIYRSLCRQAHAKRWSLLNGDEVDAAIRARGNT
jgi:hypothetical protein